MKRRCLARPLQDLAERIDMTSGSGVWRHMALAITLLAALPAPAATMLGTVLRDGQPPRPGLQLRLGCGNKPEATTTTDARGGYRLTVAGAGRCRLSVDGASTEVMLNNQMPVQYDFDLQGSGAAARLLRR
jgi:hypothetical protein